MVGTLEPTGPYTPEGGSKDDDRQEEENAGDFKPEDAAYAAEGAQETAYAACDAAGSLASHLTCRAVLYSCGCGGLWSGLASRSLGAGRYLLAGDAPGDTQADSESATDGVGFHTVYDGSSAACRDAFSQYAAASELPLNGDGSKVDKSHAATGALSGAGRRPWRYP